MEGKIIKMKIVASEKCVGCGLCYEVCPVGAISMETDPKGFLYPVIDENKCISCDKCRKKCPARVPFCGNDDSFEAYAFSSDDETLRRSSSGGLFTILCEEIISHGGVVVGAAWADNFNVKHKLIDSIEGIRELNYSKYAQSNIVDSFKQVKNELEQGRKVLYSGCPCQIAAIKRYIGENDNLLTVDVICHGVPSSQMLRDHLEENFNIEEIAEVCFRSKEGWGSCFDIYMKDGSVIHRTNGQDRFMTGFLYNFILRKSCTDCDFAKVPRQGDITIGDLWSASEMNLDIPWEKGISTVLINNERGRRLFDEAIGSTERTVYSRKLEGREGLNDNLFRCTSRNSYAGGRFDKHYAGGFFDREVRRTMHDYDTGLVLHLTKNYGSVATNLATVFLMEDMNQKAVLLDNIVGISVEGRRVLSKYVDMASDFLKKGDYSGVNEICDTFVVGSDISWYWYSWKDLDLEHLFFMNFADKDKKLISIAPSVNDDASTFLSSEFKELVRHYLGRIDYISMREESAAKMFRQEFGLDVMNLMDPVFLCDKKKFRKVANEAADQGTNHIFAYFLNPNSEKKELLLRVIDEEKKDAVIIGDLQKGAGSVFNLGQYEKGDVSFEQWLAYIINSDVVVTDSFHGACFALMFHKPFVVVRNRMAHRYATLEKLIDMPEVFASSPKEFMDRERICMEFDWEEIDKRVAVKRNESIEWVKDAFAGPLKEKQDRSRELATIVKESIKASFRLEEEKNKNKASDLRGTAVREAVQNGGTVLDGILRLNDLDLSEAAVVQKNAMQAIGDVETYFEEVRRRGLYVIVAAQDCCSTYFDSFMKKAQLVTNQKPGFRHAYAMLTDGQKIDFEEASSARKVRYRGILKTPRSWEMNLNEICVMADVLSLGNDDATGYSTSSIMINNVDYSCKGRGFNGATINSAGEVIDMWNVDLYDDSSLVMNRKNVK